MRACPYSEIVFECSLELLQEAQVIAPVIANVADAVFQVDHALRSHAESEAAPHGGVVTAVFEDDGMHHAAAGDFEPAAVLAHGAAFAVTEQAFGIDFHARLGEREIGRAEAHFGRLPEHAAGELGDGAFEVGEVDVFANRQTFDLIELDFAAHGDLLVAVAHAGQDDADGQRAVAAVFTHGTDLPRRGVGAQDDPRRGGVERVPHIAGGVVRRDVEQGEVGVVVLHVAAAVDLKAHIRPNRIEVTEHAGGGVQPADRTRATGQGDIDRAAFEILREFLRFHQHFAFSESIRQRGFDLIGALAEVGALLFWQAADAAHDFGDRAFFAEVLDFPFAQGVAGGD